MQFFEIFATLKREQNLWVATVSEDWQQGRSLFGGLQAALAVKAMHDLVPDVPLRSLQTTFLAPVAAGTVSIRAQIQNVVFFWMRKLCAAWLCILGLSGCATAPVLQPASDRPFHFPADSFAFNNDLVWDYHFDKETGAIRTVPRDPKPDYTHHCFVVARSARQFFQFAKFDASRPPLKDDDYRRLIGDIVEHDPSETENLARVIIPGFADLRSFSASKERLLKQELGSAAMSFLQRGNWRMVFPFWRGHQEETAQNLLTEVRVHRPPVVHLATFPRETINHAVLIYDATENAKEIRFKVYDPNNKDQPTVLTYDRATKTFYFPPSSYFMGGRVDAYEVYNSLMY